MVRLKGGGGHPSHPLDYPNPIEVDLQAHREITEAKFTEIQNSFESFCTQQNQFCNDILKELRQLRMGSKTSVNQGDSGLLQFGTLPATTSPLKVPASSVPSSSTTTVSTSPSSLITGNPSSPINFQLPEPPLIPNSPQNLPPPSSLVVKPISILENIKPKFQYPLILSPPATTKKDPTMLFELSCSQKNMVKRTRCKRSLGIDVSKPIQWMGRRLGTGRIAKIQNKAGNHTSRFYQKIVEPMSVLYLRHMGEQGKKIQVTFEDLKKIGKGQELQQSFSGVDKRVRDKGGGHTFQLGNNSKVITIMSHDPQYWKSVLNGFIWSVFEHRTERTGNALLNVNYKVLLKGNGWLVHLQLVTKIKLMKLMVDKAFRISSMVSYDGPGHQFIWMDVEQIKYVLNKLCADLQSQEEMKTVSYKMVEAPKGDIWAELICINGLNSAVLVSLEFQVINSKVGCWSAVQFVSVFIKLFVKVFVKMSIVKIGATYVLDASLLAFYIGIGKVTKFYETKLLVGIHFTALGNIESVIPLLFNDIFEILKSVVIVFVEKLGGDEMRMFELLDKQGLKPCSQTLPTVLLSDSPIFDGGDCLDKSLTAVPNYVEIEPPDSYYSSKIDEASCVLVLNVSKVINDSYIEKWRCLTSATTLDKERKIMRVMTNAGYELTYIEVSIGVCKLPQLVVNEITKSEELLHAMVGGECVGGVFFMLYLLDLVKTLTWTWEIDKLGADFNSKELKGTFNRLTEDSVINLLLIVYMAVIVCRNFLKLSLEHSKQVKVLSLQVSHNENNCQQRQSYLADIVRYWFNWKLLSWVTLYKLKKVIGNTEQWFGKRAVHKLPIKYYGLFEVIEKIKTVAYKHKLLASAIIHSVFLVSLLKKKVDLQTVVNPHLPPVFYPKIPRRYHAREFDTMLGKRKGQDLAKWWIQWVGTSMEKSTWQEAENIGQHYPNYQT